MGYTKNMEQAGENKTQEKRRFEIGQEVLALSGPFKIHPRGRIVTIQEIFNGPDGKTWIRAWWPGQDTDAELE